MTDYQVLLYVFSLLLCIKHAFMSESYYIQAWTKLSGGYNCAWIVQNDHTYIVIIIQWKTPFESTLSLYILLCSHLKCNFIAIMPSPLSCNINSLSEFYIFNLHSLNVFNEKTYYMPRNFTTWENNLSRWVSRRSCPFTYSENITMQPEAEYCFPVWDKYFANKYFLRFTTNYMPSKSLTPLIPLCYR